MLYSCVPAYQLFSWSTGASVWILNKHLYHTVMMVSPPGLRLYSTCRWISTKQRVFQQPPKWHGLPQLGTNSAQNCSSSHKVGTLTQNQRNRKCNRTYTALNSWKGGWWSQSPLPVETDVHNQGLRPLQQCCLFIFSSLASQPEEGHWGGTDHENNPVLTVLTKPSKLSDLI